MPETLRRSVVRPHDLLVVELHFHDLTRDPSGKKLLPAAGGEPLIVAHLPPQHLAEEAFERPPTTDAPIAAASISAERSRLAFRVPAGTVSVPLQLDALLEFLASCELKVVDAALPRSDDRAPSPLR